jgi:hypothetical protein
MSAKLGKRILKGIGMVSLSSVVLAGALAGYLVYSHDQSLVLPPPTGSYTIGRTDYVWVDENRIDPLSGDTKEKRELLVWLWYPATTSQRDSIAPYVPPAW